LWRELLLLGLLERGKLEIERDGGGEHPGLLRLGGLGTRDMLLLLLLLLLQLLLVLLLLLLLLLSGLSGSRARDGRGCRVLTPGFGYGDLREDEGEDAGLVRDGDEDETVVGRSGETDDTALQVRFRQSRLRVGKRGQKRRTFDLDSILALNLLYS
jgi:hypothetical protein